MKELMDLHLNDDETFVEGRSPELARDLLAKAKEADIDPARIRTTFRGFIVPKELGAGEGVEAVSTPAEKPADSVEPEEPKPMRRGRRASADTEEK